MKKILSIALGAAAMMGFFSCSEDAYNDKYADPAKTSTVSVPNVFTAIQQNGNTWMNPMYWRYYTQGSTSGVFSGVVGTSNDRGRFRGASEGYYNIRWKNYYDMLTQFRVLEDNYNAIEDAGQKAANEVFYQLGRTMVEAQLHEVLSLWGDVPFNGAGILWKTGDYAGAKQAAVYEDDVVLYKQILSDLKATGDYLAGDVSAAGLASLSRQDLTDAKGDKEVWRRYVNSLRLRIALHLATNGDCTADARAAIGEILNNPSKYPVVESNSQNMTVCPYTGNDDFNFGKGTSQALAGAPFSNGSQAMLTAMKVPANGVPDANTDPRLAAVYDCNPDGAYIAFDVTKSSSEISDIADAKNQAYVAAGIPTSNYYCKIDTCAIAGWASYQGNENLTGLWMSAAEVSLSKAEAYLNGYGVTADAAKAKQYLAKGAQESIEYYWDCKLNSSLTKAGNDSYNGYRELVVPTTDQIVAYANSLQANEQEIATQLWLNHSYMNMLEAWNVTRRTGYPLVDFASDALQSDYANPPARLPYVVDEINYNADNLAAAIANNYKENSGYYTPLFWAKDKYYNIVANK